jgi:phosphatidylglycerophosphate synthase
MIDEPFRQWLARHASAPVAMLARCGLTPNGVTWGGLGLGVGAAALVVVGRPVAGFALWLGSRVFDGYDGLLARHLGRSSLFGGYLDITADMAAYSAMACAFAWSMPADRLLWMLVVVGYVLAITTTLALSSLAERADRQLGGNRSLQFTPGLAEAGETTIVYGVIALLPAYSRVTLLVWIGLLAATAIQRTVLARRMLER